MSANAHSAPSLHDRTNVKYALALLLAALFGALLWGFAQRADAAVYYASNSKIGRINLDGTGANGSYLTGLSSEVGGVAVNETYIYWSTNLAAGKISRERLDGTGGEEVLVGKVGEPTPPSRPQAIAIDGTYIYWGNANAGTIGRAKLDGSEVNESFITGASGPNGIAVNSEYIYWANNTGKSIGRAKIDGEEVNQKFINDPEEPLGVAIDAEHIYWANFFNTTGSTIGRANLDGSGVNEKFITTALAPRSVAVDAEHVYWSNFGLLSGTTYGRANLDGSGINQSFITGASKPFGIAADARRGTSTTVTCEPGLVGQPGNCTAMVTDTESGTPVTPTGTVTFSSTDTGGTFEGDGTCVLVPGGTAAEAACSLAYTPSEVGGQTITAKFPGGPTANSGSGTTELTVAAPPTTTTVACTPNPVFVESETSCLATVTGPVGASAPTGEVTFSTTGTGTFEGGETCTLAPTVGEAAACSLTYKTTEDTGTETITADYGGDPAAGPSSGETELTVASVPTVTATTVACTPNPVSVGTEASCVATVTGLPGSAGPPAGEVTFDSTGSGSFGGGGACTLTPGAGAEESACSVTYKPNQVGTVKETITADFGGGPGADPSSGTTELTVAPLTTTTAVACTPNTVYTNVEVTCVATVTDTSGASATVPTGEVKFTTDKDGTFESGTFPAGNSCTLVAGGADSASCQVSYTNNVFGNRVMKAAYQGDLTHASSSGQQSVEILMVHKSKSTLICATETPQATVPVSCTFTVIDSELAGTAAPWEGPEEGTILLSTEVKPTAPTGTVTFASDSGGSFDRTTCAVTPVSGASSSCTVTFTPAAKGIVNLSASFDGTPAYLPTSATAALKVGPPPAGTQPLQCQPGFQPTGDPPVCKEPTKPIQTEPPPPKPFSRSRPTIDRKKGTATVPVYLPGPGRVVVRGAGVVKVTKKVTAAGRLKIVVRATGSAARTLRSKGHVALKVLVTYTPTGGKARTLKVPVRLVVAGKKTHRSR